MAPLLKENGTITHTPVPFPSGLKVAKPEDGFVVVGSHTPGTDGVGICLDRIYYPEKDNLPGLKIALMDGMTQLGAAIWQWVVPSVMVTEREQLTSGYIVERFPEALSPILKERLCQNYKGSEEDLTRVFKESSEEALRTLLGPFQERFARTAGRLFGGMAGVFIVALPGDQGLAIFNVGDTVALVARRNEIIFQSEYRNTSFCCIGIESYSGKPTATCTPLVSTCILSKKDAEECVLIGFSDGWTLGKDRSAILNALKPHLHSAESALDCAWRHMFKIDQMLIDQARHPKRNYQADDLSFFAVNGTDLLLK